MFDLAQVLGEAIRQYISVWPMPFPAPFLQAEPSISITSILDLVTKGGALVVVIIFGWGFIKKDPWFVFYREYERTVLESEKKDVTIETLNHQLNRLTGVAEKIVDDPPESKPPPRRTATAYRLSARRREGEGT